MSKCKGPVCHQHEVKVHSLDLEWTRFFLLHYRFPILHLLLLSIFHTTPDHLWIPDFSLKVSICIYYRLLRCTLDLLFWIIVRETANQRGRFANSIKLHTTQLQSLQLRKYGSDRSKSFENYVWKITISSYLDRMWDWSFEALDRYEVLPILVFQGTHSSLRLWLKTIFYRPYIQVV